MIQVDLVDYCKLTKRGMQITQYVNQNLKDIIRVLIDIIETDSEFGLDGFFPRDYLERKPEECRRVVYELYELIGSSSIREFIKPKYEYLLYAILIWWEECADSKEDLIINPVDNSLKEDLDDEEGQYILRQIQDYEEYYYFCFKDFDFLPRQLSNMVMLYIQNPELVEMLFQHDNLDDYIDLMECDLRERYLEIRCKKSNTIQSPIDQNIIMEIISTIKHFQKRIPHFEKRDEVQITADLQDAVVGTLNSKYGLTVAREFTMGRALQKLGETDLYIYKEQDGVITDYAVLENKYLERFTEQYNQLMGYLNPYFKFGITLSLNRKMSWKQGFDEIERKLKAITGDFTPTSIRRIGENETVMIISEHTVPETGNKMKVYHLIFQLNDSERREVAKLARKKQHNKSKRGCKTVKD